MTNKDISNYDVAYSLFVHSLHVPIKPKLHKMIFHYLFLCSFNLIANNMYNFLYRALKQKLTYQEACIVSKYLSSTHSFCQNFDIYLQQIFRMLNEPAVALRTKAVKALASIVSVDPNILGRVGFVFLC